MPDQPLSESRSVQWSTVLSIHNSKNCLACGALISAPSTWGLSGHLASSSASTSFNAPGEVSRGVGAESGPFRWIAVQDPRSVVEQPVRERALELIRTQVHETDA
jgi:hypothetical protein